MIGDIFLIIVFVTLTIIFYYKGLDGGFRFIISPFKRDKPLTKKPSMTSTELQELIESFRKKPTKDKRSRTIPQNVKDKVWNRDGGKCVKCGSNKNLEFDHIIPFSKGGSNTYRNLQLLCENCNRSKSDKIG